MTNTHTHRLKDKKKSKVRKKNVNNDNPYRESACAAPKTPLLCTYLTKHWTSFVTENVKDSNYISTNKTKKNLSPPHRLTSSSNVVNKWRQIKDSWII